MLTYILLLISTFNIQNGFSQVLDSKPAALTKKTLKKATPIRRAALRPTPSLARGQYVTMKASTPLKPLTIAPPPHPVNETEFRVEATHSGNNHHYTLNFYSKDPKLALSLKHPLRVRMIPNAPYRTHPVEFTASTWPKNENSVPISLTPAPNGAYLTIRVKATYTYCNKMTTQCVDESTNTLLTENAPPTPKPSKR